MICGFLIKELNSGKQKHKNTKIQKLKKEYKKHKLIEIFWMSQLLLHILLFHIVINITTNNIITNIIFIFIIFNVFTAT